jgi:hypothetical protein
MKIFETRQRRNARLLLDEPFEIQSGGKNDRRAKGPTPYQPGPTAQVVNVEGIGLNARAIAANSDCWPNDCDVSDGPGFQPSPVCDRRPGPLAQAGMGTGLWPSKQGNSCKPNRDSGLETCELQASESDLKVGGRDVESRPRGGAFIFKERRLCIPRLLDRWGQRSLPQRRGVSPSLLS